MYIVNKRQKESELGLKVCQNSLEKIKAVILAGEKMVKTGENWCVFIATIAFCMKIALLLREKNYYRNRRYVSVVRMKIHSKFLHYTMLRHKIAFTCFKYLKNYSGPAVLIWKIINNITALLTWLLTIT